MSKNGHKHSRSRSTERRKEKKDKHKRKHKSKHRNHSRSKSPYSRLRSPSRSPSPNSYTKQQNKRRQRSRSRSYEKRPQRGSPRYTPSPEGRHSPDKSRKTKRSPSRERKVAGRFENVTDKASSRRRADDGGDRQRKRFSVNHFALAGFIADNQKTNKRLDKDEVTEANGLFKKIDHSDRAAKLMSAHLNSEEVRNQDEYVMEYVNGEYVRVMKPFLCAVQGCGLRFRFSTDLEDHLKTHEEEEAPTNKKRAEDFLKNI